MSTDSPRDTKTQLKKMVPGLLRDIALPVGSYYILINLGYSEVISLIAGGIVSAFIVLFELIRQRTFDFIALFMLSLFVVGLGTLFITGDPRFMLAKDSIGTSIAGLFFIGSALVGKPIVVEFARKSMSGERLTGFNNALEQNPLLRRAFKNATIFAGCILLAEAIIRIPLIYSFPIDVMVAVSPIMGIATTILTVIFSIKYVKWTMAKKNQKG